MSIAIVRTLPEDTWRSFVDEHPDGNIFHTPEMFHVFSHTRGYQPELWVATDGGRVLALLLPVCITLMGGLLRYLTTRAVVYGSVLCAPEPEGYQALAKLLDTYIHEPKGECLFTELRNLLDMSPIQPVLAQAGWGYEEHLNFLIDLDQPEDTLWHQISKSGRQSVRTSRNKGTIIEEATERRQVAIAYGLLRGVYARAKVPLASLSLFEMAFDILFPRGMFKIFLARLDEGYIGACLVLMHKGRIIDWYAASERAFAAYSPGELLIWHILKWGVEHGFRLFDFGGAGKPDEDYGPRKFKAKFGGQMVNYGRNICVHRPRLLRLSQYGYQMYRRFL